MSESNTGAKSILIGLISTIFGGIVLLAIEHKTGWFGEGNVSILKPELVGTNPPAFKQDSIAEDFPKLKTVDDSNENGSPTSSPKQDIFKIDEIGTNDYAKLQGSWYLDFTVIDKIKVPAPVFDNVSPFIIFNGRNVRIEFRTTFNHKDGESTITSYETFLGEIVISTNTKSFYLSNFLHKGLADALKFDYYFKDELLCITYDEMNLDLAFMQESEFPKPKLIVLKKIPGEPSQSP